MKDLKIEDKIFFLPGDLVTIKQDVTNKPVMIVVRKETRLLHPTNDEQVQDFLGIRCRWFTTTNELQEAIWNTKDLIKVESNSEK